MIGRGSWILGHSAVLNNRNITAIPVHGVGDCLEPAVRESHEVLAIGVGSGSALLVAEVIVGRLVLHSILPNILGISLYQRSQVKDFV